MKSFPCRIIKSLELRIASLSLSNKDLDRRSAQSLVGSIKNRRVKVMSDKIEGLKQLKQLLDEGVISSEEFNKMKQDLIAGQSESSFSPKPKADSKSHRALIYIAKSRAWAHWLFWLVTPFGGIISCAKTRIWILGWVFGTAIFFDISAIASLGEQDEDAFYGASLLSTVANIVGGVITSQKITNARKQLGIDDPLEADRMFVSGK